MWICRIALLVSLVGVLALGGACAGTDGEEPGPGDEATPGPTRTADIGVGEAALSEEAAGAIAETALLRLEDFPTGWTERPAEEDDGLEVDLPPECQSFIEQETRPGTLVKVASPEFHGPDDEEVESEATVYVDVGSAQAVFADVSDFIERCRVPLREAFTEALGGLVEEEAEDSLFEDIEITDFNIDRLSFPSYGDQSASFRISVEFQLEGLSFDVYMDVFGIRVDRMTGSMSFLEVLERPDTDQEERLLGIIEQRLATAAAQLD